MNSAFKAVSHGKRCLEWKQGCVFVTRKLPCSTLQRVAWRGICSRWSKISEFDYHSGKTQIIINKPYCNFERTRPSYSSFFCIFTLIYKKTFVSLQLIYYICTRNAYKNRFLLIRNKRINIYEKRRVSY